jgi:hypothetical protein
VTDLIAFITARLDEDERVARDATPGPWTDFSSRSYGVEQAAEGRRVVAERVHDYDDAAHIARHDPARVLRDVAAKRRLLKECAWTANCGKPDSAVVGLAVIVMRQLAAPYSGHPRYREEWRP